MSLANSKRETVSHLEVQPPPSDEELDLAIARASAQFDQAKLAVQKTWIAQAEAGRLLARKRDAFGHGKWEAWLEAHMPAHYLGEGPKRSAQDKAAAMEAWRRTARNWIKLADTIDRCPAEALEQAHTIRQLFALAGMLPEGERTDGAGRPDPLPAEVVSRIKRVTGRIRAEVEGATFSDWPADLRADLKSELEPLIEIYRSLEAA